MKGMELAKAYFEQYGREIMEHQFSQYREQIAAGLAGEGSECLGFDDEYSRDHDFGPGFCLWIPEQLYSRIGTALQQAYDSMPASYEGYTRIQTPQGGGRVGVLTIEGFFRKYIGLPHAPKDNMEWFRIPQSFLATATNGQVFCDPLGEFSSIRNILKGFYPRDVLKKKLAAKCVFMAQSGQYNYPRSMKRGDSCAAYFACGEFVKSALSAIYLLNEAYMPFYKWAFRAAEELTVLKEAVGELKELMRLPDNGDNRSRKEWLMENICIQTGRELNRQGLTLTTESFLQAHGEELMRTIEDSRLRNLHIMADCDS